MYRENERGSEAEPVKNTNDITRRTDTAQFVEFEIDSQRYAFPIGQIREILILKSVTPTPQVPRYVEGVSNLRGVIIPIVNLRVLFGLEPSAPDSETRTIVVNVAEKTIGCTVDMVSRVLRVDKDSIAEAPENITCDGRHYIRGFIKAENRLVIVLDVEQLLSLENLSRETEFDPKIGYALEDN